MAERIHACTICGQPWGADLLAHAQECLARRRREHAMMLGVPRTSGVDYDSKDAVLEFRSPLANYELALYVLDRNTPSARGQRVEVGVAEAEGETAACYIDDFRGGAWLRFSVTAPALQPIVVGFECVAGPNWVVSAAMVDRPRGLGAWQEWAMDPDARGEALALLCTLARISETAPVPGYDVRCAILRMVATHRAGVRFIGVDRMTRGGWRAVYGTAGGVVFGKERLTVKGAPAPHCVWLSSTVPLHYDFVLAENGAHDSRDLATHGLA
jgi:hypothetical protein